MVDLAGTLGFHVGGRGKRVCVDDGNGQNIRLCKFIHGVDCTRVGMRLLVCLGAYVVTNVQ